MSEIDHNPARRPERPPPRIGVRALLSASEQTARPQVALILPVAGAGQAVQQQVRLSIEEAGELAGRLLALASMARYDAAVHAALARSGVSDEAHEALLGTLKAARAHLQEPS